MPKQVLVIEYDEQVLLYVGEVLDGQGYEVVPARSAAEGFRLLTRARPALVVSTFSLPDAERERLLEETAGAAETDRVPLLFMATESGPRLTRKWTKAGVAGFVNKPFLPDELLKEVERLV